MPTVETIVPASMAVPTYSILGVKMQNRQTTRPTRASVSLAATRFSRSSRKRSHRSEEHTSELQSRENLVCRLLLEKKKCLSRVAFEYLNGEAELEFMLLE